MGESKMNKQRRLEQIKNVIREARNDVSANNASDWAAKLDKAGIVLSIVLGVIIAISYAGQIGRYSSGMGAGAFFLLFITFGVLSFFTYVIFHVISIVLEILGGVMQYTKQTAELQSILTEFTVENGNMKDNDNENASFSNKSSDVLSQKTDEDIRKGDEKNLGYRKCPNCGMKYYNSEERCSYCGEHLI